LALGNRRGVIKFVGVEQLSLAPEPWIPGVIELEDLDEMAMALEAAQEYSGPSYEAREVLEMFRQELAKGE
jgi:hypothetical protein